MDDQRRSPFAFATGPRAKWVVLAIWVIGIFVAAGPAQLPAKFTDAEENESTSFLPGDAESTKALTASEELQGGELAPAVIVYRRESGLTAADRRRIADDVQEMARERFPGVVPDGAAAAGARPAGSGGEVPAAAARWSAPAGRRRSRASRPTTPRSSVRSARRTARRRS
jgi:RND superfamily putative drug exporter